MIKTQWVISNFEGETSFYNISNAQDKMTWHDMIPKTKSPYYIRVKQYNYDVIFFNQIKFLIKQKK